MIAIEDQLARGHENVERLLLVLESHLARTLSGERADRPLMEAIVGFVEDYLELHHDPLEELVLGRLAVRLPWMAAICEAHEHGIASLRRKSARFAGALASGGSDEVEHAGFGFVSALRRRVVMEDTELLVAASCALDADDWRSIEESLGARDERRMKAEFAELTSRTSCGCTFDE